jgi:hypothetical protein
MLDRRPSGRREAGGELLFDGEVSDQELIEMRRCIAGFIERFQPETPQIWQWPRNIET